MSCLQGPKWKLKDTASLEGECHLVVTPVSPTQLPSDISKFDAPCGFGFVGLRASARVEAQSLVPCIDQTLGDCGYRRVGERRLTLEMP